MGRCEILAFFVIAFVLAISLQQGTWQWQRKRILLPLDQNFVFSLVSIQKKNSYFEFVNKWNMWIRCSLTETTCVYFYGIRLFFVPIFFLFSYFGDFDNTFFFNFVAKELFRITIVNRARKFFCVLSLFILFGVFEIFWCRK